MKRISVLTAGVEAFVYKNGLLIEKFQLLCYRYALVLTIYCSIDETITFLRFVSQFVA